MSELSDRLYLLEYKEKKKNKEMENRKMEEQQKQRKKEKEARRKQYEKDLLLSCKMDLKNIFEQEFEMQGTKAKYHFFNISTRNEIINSMAKSVLEGDFLEANYNKILNEVIKKYELNDQYNEQRNKEIAEEYVERMRPIWEKEQKQQKRKNIINNILLFILNIFAHPFILLTLIAIGFFTWMFMGALGLGFFHSVGLSIILFIVLVCGFLGFF